jgi:riboflavin kinase/FMN adenylyltransferase
LTIEAHILNFQKNIYGESVKIDFLKKLRDERAFASPENLSRQLQKDMDAAGRFFQVRRIFP